MHLFNLQSNRRTLMYPPGEAHRHHSVAMRFVKAIFVAIASLVVLAGIIAAVDYCGSALIQEERIRITPPSPRPELMGEWIYSENDLHGFLLEFHEDGWVTISETTYTQYPNFSELCHINLCLWRISHTGRLVFSHSMFKDDSSQRFLWQIRADGEMVLYSPCGKVYECYRRSHINKRRRWLE